jgi:DNA end-binding protein Ku
VEGEASEIIDIAEFVPLEQVDPIYFEKSYYLGPDKGGAKATGSSATPWRSRRRSRSPSS